MQEFLNNFHFLRPWWLLALLLPLILMFKFSHGGQSLSSWVKVCDKKLLNFLLIKGSSKQRRFVSILAFVGSVAAILALAGPSWNKIEIPSLAPQNPIMLVLDLSSDISKTDISPNRLARAKFKITDLLEQLKTQQVGLIVYSGEPFMITPITDDAQLIINLLPEVDRKIMPINGSRLDRAIDFAAQKLSEAGFTQGNIVIFAGSGGQDSALALKAAEKAKNDGYKVSALAISADNISILKEIAQRGGGIYRKISANDRDISAFISLFEAERSDELKTSDNKRAIWLDYGYYLCFIPLLCCLYFFRKGVLILVFMLSCVAPASAGFFLNNNQEGMKAFNQQDYATAAQKFNDIDWKASSLYKSGDYQKALAAFNQSQSPEALYNQGNALAKSGKIDEAIKKYEEVLKNNPNHEDAKFNLEYLKQQQQNQDQQQNQNQEQNNSDQNQEQSQQNQQQQHQNQNQQQDSQENQQQDSEEQQNQPQKQQLDEQKAEDTEQKAQQQPQPQPLPQNQNDEKEYNEQIQAREQQYREIPEDPGGLLRAFIYKEFQKNRYGD